MHLKKDKSWFLGALNMVGKVVCDNANTLPKSVPYMGLPIL